MFMDEYPSLAQDGCSTPRQGIAPGLEDDRPCRKSEMAWKGLPAPMAEAWGSGCT